MPRIHAGRTRLGKELNKINSKTDNIYSSEKIIRYGRLKKPVGGVFVYLIDIFKNEKEIDFTTGPIRLVGLANDFIARFGDDPNDLNGIEVEVVFYDHTYTSGEATIGAQSIRDKTPGKQLEETLQSAELQMTGTAFAPPGGGGLL